MPLNEKILGLIKELIAVESIESLPQNLLKTVDIIENFLPKNLNIERFEINGKYSLVVTAKNIKTPKIFLHGHVDVVPGDKEQFIPQITDQEIIGRGALDMKSGAAVLTKLFVDNLDKDIGLMITTDEERGGKNGAKALIESGYLSEFVISGETSDLKIGNQAKGILGIKIRAKGQSAHSAYPWRGKNAVHILSVAIVNLTKEFNTDFEKEEWRTTVNANIIAGGTTSNVIPKEAEAKLDIRYVPQDNPQEIIERVIKCCPNCEVEVVGQDSSAYTSPDNPYLFALKGCLVNEDQFILKHGASDVRHFNEAGVAGIVFGPSGKNLHAENESVQIESLIQMETILQNFLDKIFIK